MSELEPEQAVDGGRTVGAGWQPDAAAAGGTSATSSDTDAGVPEPTVEGESRAAGERTVDGESRAESPVSAALADLDGLAEQPVADHPGIYGRVHTQLQRALSAIDDA